ncbi:hypothetical protein B9Z55_027634 [Caenorhabditis nigoni]|uniref:Uncharacterized protein n=1 Tax=Caenorhabditis nigoni TaxID=1611254 RepID=A0A2G5SEJ2_9PELO|nr:hypothetical protein B9Z55_027634 [Caenorhabditis nigoni]
MLCSTLNQKWIVKAVGKIVGFGRAEYQNVVCHLSLEIENLVVTSTKLNFLLRGHLPLLSGHLEYKKEKKRKKSRKFTPKPVTESSLLPDWPSWTQVTQR